MEKKFRYIIETFRQSCGWNHALPDIHYGTDAGGEIFIRQGDTRELASGKEVTEGIGKVVWKTWKGSRIPFFFSDDQEELISIDGSRIIVNFDIIASAFYLLSGWQEFYAPEKDEFSRYRFKDSCQNKLGFTTLPVVNYYFDILRTAVEKVSGKPMPDRSWDGADFAVCLTHDIDTCESAWLQGSFHALKRKALLKPFSLLVKKMLGRDAWFNFSEILEVERDFRAPSTFFFLPRRKPNMGIKNADYEIGHKKFLPVFASIQEAGSEIGLHGSIGSSSDPVLFKEDMTRIPAKIHGNRFHFLLYDARSTPGILEQSGLAYDSSLGFAEAFGFRNSFCLPFRPYDLVNDVPMTYYEIPLVLMDGTLQKYMKKSSGEAVKGLEELIDEVRKFNGLLTLLWHNTHFSEYKYPGWRDVYLDLLRLCQNKGAWFASCSGMLKKFVNG